MAAMPPPDDPLVLVFIPSLAELLVASEKEKGAPLSQEEVMAIRDKAVCMTVLESVARSLEERRGYRDLDPEQAWPEWLSLRRELEGRA